MSIKIELDDEWRDILANSWNFRFVVLTGFFSGTAVAAQMLQPYLNTRPVVVAIVVFVCTMLSTITSGIAGFARIVKQGNLDK